MSVLYWKLFKGRALGPLKTGFYMLNTLEFNLPESFLAGGQTHTNHPPKPFGEREGTCYGLWAGRHFCRHSESEWEEVAWQNSWTETLLTDGMRDWSLRLIFWVFGLWHGQRPSFFKGACLSCIQSQVGTETADWELSQQIDGGAEQNLC